jgi:cation transport ATPase
MASREQAADLTLIGGEVRGVAKAIGLSKATVCNIKRKSFDTHGGYG